jgi:hypothetical protein
MFWEPRGCGRGETERWVDLTPSDVGNPMSRLTTTSNIDIRNRFQSKSFWHPTDITISHEYASTPKATSTLSNTSGKHHRRYVSIVLHLRVAVN